MSSNNIESVSLRKCLYDNWVTKAYLSAITVTNISQSFFIQDGGRNQLAYGTKLRHCRHMYIIFNLRTALTPLWWFVCCCQNFSEHSKQWQAGVDRPLQHWSWKVGFGCQFWSDWVIAEKMCSTCTVTWASATVVPKFGDSDKRVICAKPAEPQEIQFGGQTSLMWVQGTMH